MQATQPRVFHTLSNTHAASGPSASRQASRPSPVAKSTCEPGLAVTIQCRNYVRYSMREGLPPSSNAKSSCRQGSFAHMANTCQACK